MAFTIASVTRVSAPAAGVRRAVVPRRAAAPSIRGSSKSAGRTRLSSPSSSSRAVLARGMGHFEEQGADGSVTFRFYDENDAAAEAAARAAHEAARPPAAKATPAEASSSTATATATDDLFELNMEEAQRWIDSWKATQAAPAAAEADAPAPEAEAAFELNMEEAQRWIDAWKATQGGGAAPSAPAASAESAPSTSADVDAKLESAMEAWIASLPEKGREKLVAALTKARSVSVSQSGWSRILRPRTRGARRSLSRRLFLFPRALRISPPRVPRFQRSTSMRFNSASDAFRLRPDVALFGITLIRRRPRRRSGSCS